MGKGRSKPRRDGPAHVAEGMRKTLLRAASRGETVNYGTLIRRFGLSRGKALTRMIAEVDRPEYAKGAPGFAAIIVRKDTGYPGGGYFCDGTLPPKLQRPRYGASDPRLTAAEKAHIIRRQRTIWEYYS